MIRVILILVNKRELLTFVLMIPCTNYILLNAGPSLEEEKFYLAIPEIIKINRVYSTSHPHRDMIQQNYVNSRALKYKFLNTTDYS